MPSSALPPHHCHAEGCEVPVEPWALLCGEHLRALPERLRGVLVRHQRRGPLVEETPTPEVALASIDARIWLAERSGHEVPGFLLSRRRILLRDMERRPSSGHERAHERAPEIEQPSLFDLPTEERERLVAATEADADVNLDADLDADLDAGPEVEPAPLEGAPSPSLPPPPLLAGAQPTLFQGAGEVEVHRIDASGPPPVRAEDVEKRPVFGALLAAMRLGPPRWAEIAEGLGASDARRVGALARRWTELAERAGLPPSRPPRGPELATLLGLLLDEEVVAAELLMARPREDGAAQVRRAWRDCARSLRAGVPVLAVVDLIAAEAPPHGGTPRWVAHAPQVWVIVEVPERLAEGEASFPLRALDPRAPGWQTLLCHHVAARPFAAPVGGALNRRWTQGSPLPALAGPWVEGTLARLAPHRRAVAALSELVGQF